MQKLINWVDERLPIVEAWNKHLAKYYAPKNFNVWYFFGSLAMLVLGMRMPKYAGTNYQHDNNLAIWRQE